AWKAGVAGEVIGIPQGSIGERLYTAKINLSTPDLFAWTLVVIGLSLLGERLFMRALSRLQRYISQ
ncbi:MAG: nitrate ABC transporter permease, partial [Oscillospiraceae bacterium]|nr:nitrate ABC transporter permease [Oscillospiraceae bacterium]